MPSTRREFLTHSRASVSLHRASSERRKSTGAITAEDLSRFMPSPPILSSHEARWGNQISVRTYHLPPGEAWLPAVPDPCIMMQLSVHPTEVQGSFGDRLASAIFDLDALSLVPPDCASYWRWSGEVDVLHVHISQGFINKCAARAPGFDAAQFGLMRWFCAYDALISQLGHTCVAELQNRSTRTDRSYIEMLASMLIAQIAHHHRVDMKRSSLAHGSQAKAEGIRRAISYIHDNYDASVTLEELAQLANCSLYHFIRQFRAVTGMTPHKYLINRRVEHAKKLLQDLAIPIIEVGEMCGFSSASHLTNTFRESVGVTPSVYRQRITDRPR